MIKIGLVSLGCPKNLVDGELMLGTLKNNGYEITNDPQDADIIIVNTCGFIDSAKEEAIDTILEMAEYKQGRCKALIVAGCLAQRYKEEILREMPEVDYVLGTGCYDRIAEAVELVLESKSAPQCLIGELNSIDYLNSERIVSTPKAYAYIKIAEGCDNFCSYCIIPYLRGRFRSRRKEDIVKEAERLVCSGTKELILVAQDTTRYGLDLYGKSEIADLLRRISEIPGDFRIRTMYCYPDELTDEFIYELENNKKLCKYLDLPVQHASNNILKSMGRRDTKESITERIDEIRRRIPDVYIRTSLIVGFPGETEEDFNDLYEFVDKIKFDRLGVFAYSKEAGTRAAKMKAQIPKKIKEERLDKIMRLQKNISKDKNISRIGNTYDVIVEGVAEDGIFYFGRTYAEAPEIDGYVYFTSLGELDDGDVVKVKILNIDEYDLIGEHEK